MTSTEEALKKPSSAYFLWQNANREKIQKMVGSKDFKVVAAKTSELWKCASDTEKKPFEAEAKRQKDTYDAFIATAEGQKALQDQKALKKGEKHAKQEKEDEKAKIKEEKQVAKDKREAKAAVKAIEKDERLKKPLTAYFMWLNDNRTRIVAMVGGKGGPEVTKKGSQMWNELSENKRKPYEDRARKEKEAYEAYISTAEGAAALKAYKDATAAVAYKEKVAEDDGAEDDGKDESPKKAAAKGSKRKVEEVASIAEASAKKDKKVAKAGA